MAMNKNIIYLLWIVFLASCSHSPEPSVGNVIPVSKGVSNVVDKLLLSKIAESLEIVPLETTDSSLFNYSRIRNIAISSDLILVNEFDRILSFSRSDGKYLRDIGQFGQGGVDFNYCSGLGINANKKCIYVASGFSSENKLKIYSFDGKYQGDMPVAKTGIQLMGTTDHRELRDYVYWKGKHILRRMLPIWDGSNELWQIKWLDESGNELARMDNPACTGHEKEISTFEMKHVDDCLAVHSPMMNFYGNRISVLFELSDTIYQYAPDNYTPEVRYILDTERNRNLDFYGMTRNGKSRTYMEEIIPKEIYETRDYIYLSVEKDDCSYLVEWNKQTGEICSVKNRGTIKEVRPGAFLRKTLEAGWVNDISGGPNFYHDHHSANNEWIAMIPAEELLKVDLEALKKADVKSPALRDKLVKIIEGLDAEVDNPILMIVKLKE